MESAETHVGSNVILDVQDLYVRFPVFGGIIPRKKAEVRAVKPGPRLGNLWVIEDGLKAGDRVVVEGIQKARPGMPLNVTSIDPAALTPDVPANTAPGA